MPLTSTRNVFPSSSLPALVAELGALPLHAAEAVALLCDRGIAQLSRHELISLVAACHHLWTDEDLTSRLPFAEDHLLRQLAYLARQCCRVRATQGQRNLAS